MIAFDDDKPARAYAFKTVRSPHTQSLFDHIVKAVGQIEQFDAGEGIVAFHLTPRLQDAGLWPENGFFIDWAIPADDATNRITAMFGKIVADNGQAAVAKPAVLSPTLLRQFGRAWSGK